MEYFKIEFEPYINYEAIITTTFNEKEREEKREYNAACIGVHFAPDGIVYLHLFDDTDTKRLLIPGKSFMINFSDDFIDYVYAAIRGKDKERRELEFSKESFREDYNEGILKSAWLTVKCEVVETGPQPFDLCKRTQKPNIKAKVNEIVPFRFPRIFNNRAMNLALEALIIATRLPILKDNNRDFMKNLKFYKDIKRKLKQWRDFERFHEGFEIMDSFLINKGISLMELYE